MLRILIVTVTALVGACSNNHSPSSLGGARIGAKVAAKNHQNCGFPGISTRSPEHGTLILLVCDNKVTGKEEEFAIPISTKLQNFVNLKIKLYLENEQRRAEGLMVGSLTVVQNDTEIGFLGNDLYFGRVCSLQYNDRNASTLTKQSYAECVKESLAEKLTAVKSLLQLATPENWPADVMASLENNKYNEKEIVGVGLLVDLSANFDEVYRFEID